MLLLLFSAISIFLKGQITESDGLRMPGDWNAWTNSLNMGGAFDLQKITTGTIRWHTKFQYTGTTGPVAFKFVSGGSGNPWYNQWANTSFSINQIISNIQYCGCDIPNNNINITNGKWYTVNWQDLGYTNTNAIFMETSAEPVQLVSLSYSPNTSIMPWDAVTVNLTVSASPSPEEKVFLRYTTDNFANSSLIPFSFSGTTGTATIPAFAAGTSVRFYAYSTTLDAANIGNNHDMATIRLLNNGGTNYNYTVITPSTVSDGLFSSTSTWINGIIPSLGDTLKINHIITLDQNYSAATVAISSTGHLIINDNINLTIEGNGSWTNNGLFTPNNGSITFQSNVSTGGTNISTFQNVIIEGTNVNFNFSKSRVSGILSLTTGSILNAPELLEGSTLRYAQGGYYQRVTEWNNPWNVTISNNTNLDLNMAAFGSNMTIRGNLQIEAGSTLDMANGVFNLIVDGNILIDGELKLSTSIGGDLQAKGNWSRSGTFTPNNRLVTFNGGKVQILSGHTTFNYLTIEGSQTELQMNDGIRMQIAASEAPMQVRNAATLNTTTQIVDGNGHFTLESGATLKTAHPDGISITAATGTIQTSGKTLANDANFHFTGSGNQKSGNAIPLAAAAKTIIVDLANDESTLSINTSTAVIIDTPGKLEIRRGSLLETQNFDSKSFDGNGNLVMTGGNYIITSIGKTVDKPRLTGNYEISNGTIELSGNGNQKLRSGKTYHHLTFGGTDTVFVTATPEINGTVTIKDSKIAEVGNSTFGKAITNLNMSGGRLRLSGARTLPDMQGTYTLSGGVIEFAGNSDNHQIRGGKTYYNIEITGANVSTSGANFSISNNFIIKPGGVFEMASTRAIEGSGDFVVEANGTLLYGSANGIKLSGTGSSDGNIRVTGSRIFSPAANYGFIGGADQLSGDGLPATVRNLIVNKSAAKTITLSQSVSITESITLTSGPLITGNNTLSLENNSPSALIAGSGNSTFSNSYIIGNFRRNIGTTASSYQFPIGRNQGVQTATVTFTTPPTIAGSLTASFQNTLPGNYYGNLPFSAAGVFVNTLANEGFWKIDAGNGLEGGTYNINLFARGFDSVINPSEIRILKRTDGDNPWELAGTYTFPSYTGDYPSFSFTQTSISGFSEFALGSNFNQNPLPVELLSFKANPCMDGVVISWSTASEINNDFFSLEHSNNGKDFLPIARIQGNGTTTAKNDYSFHHLFTNEGLHYYRLTQTDFDATSKTYSPIAVHYLKSSTVNEIIGPMKLGQTYSFAVNNPENSNIQYWLFDSKGRLVLTESQNESLIRLNFSDLSNGIYFLRVRLPQGVSSKKFVVKH